MARSRRENLHSVFVLLFLNVAFFLLEHQDPQKYASLFRFDWSAVVGGEVWRVVTWQFTQAGQGWLEALALFVTLLLLYMMGSAIEEEWGTRHFFSLFAISTLTSAGVAALLGVPLLGTYFVYYTLLFVYAAAFPQQTLFLFGVVPVRFRLIALVSFAALVYGVFAGGLANIAALAGAMSGVVYFLLLRVRIVIVPTQQAPAAAAPRIDTTALHNAARFAAMKQALASGSAADAERLIAQCERDKVPNVNICPPADFKPQGTDGYCIRCEGFAECSARHLRARLAASASVGTTASTAPPAPPEPAPLA
jgi:membrane associated rhomboid family serine protease